MRVYTSFNDLPELEGVVITIGSYDGVHAGHQHILKQLFQTAHKLKTQSVLMTFYPHPRQVLFPDDDSLQLLTTKDEKVQILSDLGVDILVIVPFTTALSQLSPEDYLKDILIRNFNPSVIIIGYDHKFGNGRAGDIHFLKEQRKSYNYHLEEISEQQEKEIKISSTRIRNYLLQGDLENANLLLGRPYAITGEVIHGRHLGKEIGYPTANIKVISKAKLIPMDGIYVCYIHIDNRRCKGMMYIGDIPTINEDNPKTIEVNIFEFDRDIYGSVVTIELLSFIRHDIKFSGLEALTLQLAKDEEASKAYFEGQNSKKKSCKTTVAILGYNSATLIRTYLPSLMQYSDEDSQLLFIDNASTDQSLDILESEFREINVLKLKENFGYAGGYNEGLKGITSTYIVLVNSDIRVSENWLYPLVEFMDANPDYGAAMPKILSDSENESFEYAGASGGFLDSLSYPYCRGRIFDTIEKDEGQYDNIADVDWVSGAAFIIRRTLFEELGGFDQSYFAHQEEIDLCWRIRRRGYKLAVIPSSLVYHLGGGTLDYSNSKKVYLNFRNNLLMIVKNEELSVLFWKIPLRLFLDGIAGVKMLLEGSFASCWAIIKAHFSFYSRFFSARKKHKSIRSDKKSIARLGLPSILWTYHVRGKKTFRTSNYHNEKK